MIFTYLSPRRCQRPHPYQRHLLPSTVTCLQKSAWTIVELSEPKDSSPPQSARCRRCSPRWPLSGECRQGEGREAQREVVDLHQEGAWHRDCMHHQCLHIASRARDWRGERWASWCRRYMPWCASCIRRQKKKSLQIRGNRQKASFPIPEIELLLPTTPWTREGSSQSTTTQSKRRLTKFLPWSGGDEMIL